MRFFIIGNPSSVWLKEYIKHIHIKNNHKVYVTVFEMSDLKFVNEYREKGRGIKKISKFLRLFFFAYRNRNNQFDILEVQSPPHNVQAFVIGMILITLVVTVLGLHNIFKVQTLTLSQLLTVYGLAALNLPIIQTIKAIRAKLEK